MAKIMLIVLMSSGWLIPHQWLFNAFEGIIGLPWQYLAAIEQYEQNTGGSNKDKATDKDTAITISSEQWVGIANPNQQDRNPATIRLFSGMGQDGNGDGEADPTNLWDVYYSLAHFLTRKGLSDEAIREQLWSYYKHSPTVDVIAHMSKILLANQGQEMYQNAFPIPSSYNYTFKSTWGDRRGWGGRRIHEGTDIFADYGTPVRSTCMGYIELLGWNRYGGWRIGIRDIHNRYHYFAHLHSFAKDLRKGAIVKPGQIIGSVGSTGYGPPGTAGKFPPHLHYGIYYYDGKKSVSFDPFPLLKKWEKNSS